MRIKAIINPVSGQNGMRLVVTDTLAMLEKRGLLEKNDIFITDGKTNYMPLAYFEDCDILVTAGGDGTLHNVINNMKRYGIDKPIAYLPTGTMNDFGTCLMLPRTPKDFCDMIENMELKKVDLGTCGNDYFHYVAGGGVLSSVSYSTNQKMKNFFGKGAYYFSAVLKFFSLFRSSRILIESEQFVGEEKALLYLVSNSPIVGGFQNLLPDAQIDDGWLNILVVRKCSIFKAWKLFRDIKKGKHTDNPNILYFKTQQIKITQLSKKSVMMDIDGEKHNNTRAVNIEIVPKGMTMIVPKAVPISA